MARNISRFETPASEENEFHSSSTVSILSPSRAPLNSIPDPSQLHNVNHGSDSDLLQKLEASRAHHHRTLAPERRTQVIAMHDSTPRIVGRNAEARSKPNSAQSSPSRSGARGSLGGGARVVQSWGVRGNVIFPRIPRGISVADSVSSAEAPHFELNEDASFWKEHNVQVLIRVRPLSTLEMASQGYVRCLKQESPHTLVLLGHPDTRFTFDHVACETISQEELFRTAGLPMVENCLAGYNSCMFAYGQTGSGKTYTMMGEISEVEGSLGKNSGITPRIFQHLFSRIKVEEDGRRDERLQFSCKCSFLEIYNEHITDLLEPSSTNLPLREDLAKGVYVENLVEYNVTNVNDVLKLLIQGVANRKMAATHMNEESSRSHSVLTCTVESRWERDSLTHFRFARLNLVDLAGSERQKSSGVEGDRLKEAANINKSLSTLGLVIMSLADVAHGKHRHVPYRDSRLTFLLQDSLGGNSKTMIIANVCPSLCSANETLSTLKFAQRAKLIQNNAKVNEDSSGDITALQQEIRRLKGQLSSLMKNQNSSKAVSDCMGYSGISEMSEELLQDGCHCQMHSPLSKKVETMSIRSDHRNSWSDMNGEPSNDYSDTRKELMESRSIIEAMEAEQVRLIKELKVMQEENERFRETLSKYDNNARESFSKVEAYDIELSDSDVNNKDAIILSKDLGAARKLNCQYVEDRMLKLSQQHGIELVNEQVETETAKIIPHLHEEMIALQSEFQERICNLTHENQSLKDTVTAREAEIKNLNHDWEKATIELTNFIVDGSKSIKEASEEIESIISSFPHVNVWIGDYIEKAAKVCLEKEEIVLLLQKSLEDARLLIAEMDLKLKSLKGATIALNEVRPQGNVASTKETYCLCTETDKMSDVADRPGREFESEHHQNLEAEIHAETALAFTKWPSNSLEDFGRVDTDIGTCSRHLPASFDSRCNLYNAIGSTAKDNVSGQLEGVERADGVTELENGVIVQSCDNFIYENLSLKKELERKEALFEGLLFDFRLMQESASHKRDIKDETDELVDALHQVRHELERKTIQVNDLVVQKGKHENCLSDLQRALLLSKSDLEMAEERIHALTEQNDELRTLINDLCLKKTEAEEALEEQNELVKGLESEILHLSNTAEIRVLSTVRTIEEDLRKVTGEKEQLLEEIRFLKDKLEMAYAIADEKEAIAIEAREESEASKIYAAHREEEVKILESSVEELENTVNVLERRMYDMDEEVERHRMIRDSLETELQTLRLRLVRVEHVNLGIEECEGQTSRSKEFQEALDRIQELEKEVTELNNEIIQLREYISEVVLHSEAQASGYQEKYKSLEAMVRDLNIDASISSTAATRSHKTEKSSTRTRGSGSPFRCIAGLVQQTNLEKDQELTMARLRIEELESLLAVKQKEICSLNTRIAAAESMTHDVIRDLLGVKMDMTNYAKLVDQYQVQRVLEEAPQRTEEILSKEQEIVKLKKDIAALVEERESYTRELKKKEAEVVATQISMEQLKERVELLYAQNEMLKNDKHKLLRKVAEVDDKTYGQAAGNRSSSSQCAPQTTRDDTKSVEQSQKHLLYHANKANNNEAWISRTRFR